MTLSGNREFRTEKLTAYEIGVRSKPLSGLAFSATGFYHRYGDLRTAEVGAGPGLNLFWGNNLAGHSYGVEAWASASPLPWWTLSAGATLQRENFHFKPGATAPFIGTFQNGIDPGHWITLQSSMNLGRAFVFNLDVRAVGRLEQAGVPAYAELGGHLAWNVSDTSSWRFPEPICCTPATSNITRAMRFRERSWSAWSGARDVSRARAALRTALLVVAAALMATAPAQAEVSDTAVKAAFIPKFARYVTWPATARPNSQVVICIIGDDPFGNALNQAAAGSKSMAARLS